MVRESIFFIRKNYDTLHVWHVWHNSEEIKCLLELAERSTVGMAC